MFETLKKLNPLRNKIPDVSELDKGKTFNYQEQEYQIVTKFSDSLAQKDVYGNLKYYIFAKPSDEINKQEEYLFEASILPDGSNGSEKGNWCFWKVPQSGGKRRRKSRKARKMKTRKSRKTGRSRRRS